MPHGENDGFDDDGLPKGLGNVATWAVGVIYPPPQKAWVRNLRVGDLVWQKHPGKAVQVIFPWLPPSPGEERGALFVLTERTCVAGEEYFFGGLQVLMVGPQGQGKEISQVILPIKGFLSADAVSDEDLALLSQFGHFLQLCVKQYGWVKDQDQQVRNVLDYLSRSHRAQTELQLQLQATQEQLKEVSQRLLAVEQEKRKMEIFATKGKTHGVRKRRVRRKRHLP